MMKSLQKRSRGPIFNYGVGALWDLMEHSTPLFFYLSLVLLFYVEALFGIMLPCFQKLYLVILIYENIILILFFYISNLSIIHYCIFSKVYFTYIDARFIYTLMPKRCIVVNKCVFSLGSWRLSPINIVFRLLKNQDIL